MPRSVPDAQILDAVVQVVGERGYAGATTREIARAAGINEVTLFRRFGSKAQLLSAALNREVDAFFEDLGPLHTGDLEADLVRIVRRYRAVASRFGALAPVILAEGRSEPELAEVMRIPHRMMAAIAEVLMRYQLDGQLQVEHPMDGIASLIGPILVRAMMSRAAAIEMPPVAPEVHVERFLRGFSTRSPG